MKRRPATTPIDGHAQGYFTAPLAQPLTLCLFSYPIPAFLVVCSAYTHTHNYGTVSSPAVGFSVWNFLPTQKISTWVHFRVKMQDLQTKKAAYLQGSARNRLGYLLHLFLNRLEADKHKIKQSKLQWC